MQPGVGGAEVNALYVDLGNVWPESRRSVRQVPASQRSVRATRGWEAPNRAPNICRPELTLDTQGSHIDLAAPSSACRGADKRNCCDTKSMV